MEHVSYYPDEEHEFVQANDVAFLRAKIKIYTDFILLLEATTNAREFNEVSARMRAEILINEAHYTHKYSRHIFLWREGSQKKNDRIGFDLLLALAKTMKPDVDNDSDQS